MRFLSLLLVGIALTIGGCVSTQKTQEQKKQAPDTEADWAPVKGHPMTSWVKDLSPDNVLPEYPRPQLVRERWKNLNGMWQYVMGADRTTPPFGEDLEEHILVPFAIESALSGVKERTDSLWYRHTFDIPDTWNGQRVLLHFGAVDWEAIVYVNGEKAGTHRGGYDAFSFDISEYLQEGQKQELVVKVFDPSDDGDQPRGKQVKNPRGIWYTPVTGIWQTVWLEPVPATYISDLRLTPDVDRELLNIRVEANRTGAGKVRVVGYNKEGEEIARASGSTGESFSLNVPDPHLWSPDDPYLYDLKVQLVNNGEVTDEVDSYFGMRKIELGKEDDGKTRIMLNGEFVFQLGPLDQGYWPDGLYTAPTDEALRYDLEITKRLGFNMNRKHVKVEPARWYYWADRLGVLVWQDMVTGSNSTAGSKKQFEKELGEMVHQLYNYPSIVHWVVFNEGWGQFDTKRITEKVEEWDPSRIVTDASGWQHFSAGDVIDVHRYPGPAAIKPTSDRASVVGEFGGVGFVINGHNWSGEGWGYQDIIRRPEQYINRYEYLIHRLRWMGQKYGMSAGVYTQLTDVETELNGMLTYDREVIKAAPQQFAAVNKGITPYIWPTNQKFIDEVEVRLFNWTEDSQIRYTLDGSVPDANSKLYEGPFRLAESIQVRARTFKNNSPVGYESVARFEKVSGKEPALKTAENLEEGLLYNYYESFAENAPPYRKHWPLRRQLRGDEQTMEPLASGTVLNFDISPRKQDELFAFEFEGYIEIPSDGVYTFQIAADDDAKMYIGGEQIFDRLGQSPATAYQSVRVPLKAGLHTIEVRYLQAYGPFELDVSYEGPGIQMQPVPDERLYHRDS